MDPATAGVAFATAIAQVAVTSVKLKRLWNQIEEIPHDVKVLLCRLDLADSFLTHLRNIHATAAWPEDLLMTQCEMYCDIARAELEASVQELEKKLKFKSSSRRRIGQRLVAAQAVLNRDTLAQQEQRLKDALSWLSLAYDIATRQEIMHTLRRLPSELRSDLADTPLDTTGVSIINDTNNEENMIATEDDFTAEDYLYNEQQVTHHRQRQDWALRLRSPRWWSEAVFEFKAIPRLSSYVFRIYHVVSDDSEILQSITRGDVIGVRRLFETRRASPFDVDSQGRSLLHYAADPAQPEICKMLLNLGGRDSLVVPAGEGQFTPWRSIIYHLLRADEHDRRFDQVIQLVKRHLIRAEPISREFMFDTDIIYLMQKHPRSLEILREKLLVDYYRLPIQERCSYVRWAAIYRFDCEFIRALVSKDGKISRTDMQNSIAVEKSLLHSAAVCFGLGFRPSPGSSYREKALVKSVEAHTARWSGWISDMAQASTPEDLHAVAMESPLHLQRGPQWSGTPLMTMITGVSLVLLHLEVRPTVRDAVMSAMLKAWLLALESGGVDLAAYGKREVDFIHNQHKSWEPPQAQNSPPGMRLIHIRYGAEVEDWELLWAEEIEAQAHEFWELVERPIDVVPGTWVDE